MYIFTNVFFGHRISRKLTDKSQHVQQQVLQFADLVTYGPAVHGELGRRFESSCLVLQTERQFVAFVGSYLQRCSQSEGKWTDRVCRNDGLRTTGASWRLRSQRRPGNCGRGKILHSRSWCDLGRRGLSQPLRWRARQVMALFWPLFAWSAWQTYAQCGRAREVRPRGWTLRLAGVGPAGNCGCWHVR